MNQQQLQIARAALWRQNAEPLATYDDAAAWLDATGFCLFLPRHAQLPAPAPSFAEACLGAPSATPPAAAIASAMGMAMRLMEAGRALPLNLFGTFSEQPDFLVTPDVLAWVAAVRGDRQWQKAPAGRTAPIVLRTWEALEQHGQQTAVEIRELLGRELTEAAVMRALVELWTGLRVVPSYAVGEPTRWRLLKDTFAAQLTTAANTAQPTALSAMLSLYLRSAVAATPEEAEVFLSPLTARSRIREVIHGMTAARQFGSMSVTSQNPTLGSQTMIFVAGSLPETAPEAAEPLTPEAAQEARERREAIRRRPREEQGPPRFQKDAARMQRPARFDRNRPSDRPRPAGFQRIPPSERPARSGAEPAGRKPFSRPPFDKKRAWQPRDRQAGPGRGDAPRFAGSPGDRPLRRDRDSARREDRPQRERPGGWQARDNAKPWQKRGGPRFGKRAEGPNASGPRPAGPRPQGPRQEGAPPARPWQKDRPRPPFGQDRLRGERPPRKFGDRREFSRPQNRPAAGPQGPNRQGERRDERRPGPRPTGPGRRDEARPGPRAFDRGRPRIGKPPRPDSSRPGSSRPGSSRPGSSRPGASRPGSSRPGFADKPRFGKFGSGKSSFGKSGPGQNGPGSKRSSGGQLGRKSDRPPKKSGAFRSSRPPQKNFMKPRPRKPNPGKNRKQDDSPS
ncbi:MAG TPA: hypothetical protein VIY53_05475 [Acidobacteriaceae bacterium]